MANVAPDIGRLQVHLAHQRPDLPGFNGIPPRIRQDWMSLPLDPHTWRCPLGVRKSETAALYIVPPQFAFAVDMPRYRHYSAHFSQEAHAGWRETAARQRSITDGKWPLTPMAENPVTLQLHEASWHLIEPNAGRSDILAAFDRLVAAYQSGDRFCALVALLQLLERIHGASRRDEGSRLRRFADHLAFRGHQAVTISTLAEECGISRVHLHRLCLRVYGVSPKELLLRERLAIACRALERGVSVSEAAVAAGFADAYYFSRIFARRQGMPPSQWATRLRKG